MAKTQEYYRLGARLPRYTTKLDTFANGMYLTEQTIPEGYAKVMVNYDIDDTGSHIKPRRGRKVVQNISYADRNTNALGPITLTDYIYSYKDVSYQEQTIEEVADTQDVAMSHGILPAIDIDPDNYEIYFKAGLLDTNIFISSMKYTKTTSTGDIVKYIKPFWFLVYDKPTDSFKRLEQDPSDVVGGFTARVVKNAYAFDKQVLSEAKHRLGKPISAVLNNELIAFTYDNIEYQEDDTTGTGQTILSQAELTKLKVKEGALIREIINPQQITPAEAYLSGFNLLSQDPYEFDDNVGGGSLYVLGLLPYVNGSLKLSPNINEEFQIRVYYQTPQSPANPIKYKVEVADATKSNLIYETIQDWTTATAINNGAPFYYNMPMLNYSKIAILVSLREGDDTSTEAGGTLYIDMLDNNLKNLDFRSYDLSAAKGMVSWMGCLGLYGFPDAPDTLLFSDVENPGYFPFPQNVLTFDNEILAVHNYLTNLIVVTVDSVWIVTPGTTIATSVQQKVLDNVFIPEIDALNLVVLKDQIFFKTDTQFYVLKPNAYTADKTNLKNYVNSTAIANFTKNFTAETVKLLNKVYPLMWQDESNSVKQHRYFADFDVLDIHGETREEEVHYVYKIRPKYNDNSYTLDHVDLHLVYNTLARTWRLYLVSIGDASTSYNPILYRNKQSGYFYEFFPHTLENGKCDITISKQTYDIVTDQITVDDWSLLDENSYNNYPYLDTGVVPLDDAFTKRFREVQFGLLNQEKTTIRFYSKFFLDGQERIHATRYIMQHITDETQEDYGNIYITPMEYENMALYGLTTLADNTDERDYWRLDLSKFPDLANVTVRFQLQGRGRRGSLQLLNTSLQRYQLSDLNWVYRIMSAR